MAEEKNDVIDQLVDGQSDVNAQPVPEPGVSDDAAVLADGTSQEKDVPYSRLKEANEAKKVAEEAKRLAEEQLQRERDRAVLAQANQTQVQTAVSSYEQALKDCGLAGEEYLTQEQRIQLNARKEQLDAFKTQQNQQAFADQQFAQSHSDFTTVVGQANRFSGAFMYSAELQKILTEKPHLQASCYTAQGAYQIVMQERQLAKLTKDAAAMQEHQQQLKVDAKLSPISSSAAGGGGVRSGKGQINENSTAEDVRAMEQKVKAGEFG